MPDTEEYHVLPASIGYLVEAVRGHGGTRGRVQGRQTLLHHLFGVQYLSGPGDAADMFLERICLQCDIICS